MDAPDTDTSADGHDSDGPSQAQIHDILSNERRVLALRVLRNEPEAELPLRDLSERVAAREAETNRPERNLRNSVYVSLHQSHLPKLDEYGIVEYEKDRKTVSLLEEAEDVLSYLEYSPDEPADSSRDRLYLLIGVTGALGTATLWALFGPLATALWSIGALLLVTGFSAYRLLA